MSFQDLGSIGELLGALAVLFTLIYIAVQTREARLIATAESTRGIMSGFSRVISTLNDEEMAGLVRVALNDWESLSRNEQIRVHILFLDLLVHYQSALQQESLPGMADWVISTENNMLGFIATPGGSMWYQKMKTSIAPTVVERLDSRLKDTDNIPATWPENLPWYRADD